ncbi:hypothetical protein [Burkholderia aenigmatica]|nr:hypothetical protein [Burkholderia aenigmatica]
MSFETASRRVDVEKIPEEVRMEVTGVIQPAVRRKALKNIANAYSKVEETDVQTRTELFQCVGMILMALMFLTGKVAVFGSMLLALIVWGIDGLLKVRNGVFFGEFCDLLAKYDPLAKQEYWSAQKELKGMDSASDWRAFDAEFRKWERIERNLLTPRSNAQAQSMSSVQRFLNKVVFPQPTSTQTSWRAHVYSLLQITIRLQSARPSERKSLIDQLQAVLDRLNASDMAGMLDPTSQGPSSLDGSSGSA